MSNNQIWIIAVFLIIPFFANAENEHKYLRGDCITPITQNYSWYGKYARVEAFSKVDEYPGTNYILAFPSSISNSVIFSQEIEKHTQKVHSDYCRPI